jgi:hypothetical protein
MRLWSLPMVVLIGLISGSLAEGAEVTPIISIPPAAVVGNSVVYAREQTQGGTVILRGSVPTNTTTAAPPVTPSQGQNPTLSSGAATIGWDRSGLGMQ